MQKVIASDSFLLGRENSTVRIRDDQQVYVDQLVERLARDRTAVGV